MVIGYPICGRGLLCKSKHGMQNWNQPAAVVCRQVLVPVWE